MGDTRLTTWPASATVIGSGWSLVSKFAPDGALYAPPPPAKKNENGGRPRVKGTKLKTPETVVEAKAASERRRSRGTVPVNAR